MRTDSLHAASTSQLAALQLLLTVGQATNTPRLRVLLLLVLGGLAAVAAAAASFLVLSAIDNQVTVSWMCAFENYNCDKLVLYTFTYCTDISDVRL